MSRQLYQLVLIVSMANLAYATSTASYAIETQELDLPAEIQYLLEKSKECTYWVTEWDSTLDHDYKAIIEKNINTICLEVIDERVKFLEKYKHDPRTLEHLN